MLSVYGRSAQEGAMRFRRERIVAPGASIMSQQQTRCPPTPVSSPHTDGGTIISVRRASVSRSTELSAIDILRLPYRAPLRVYRSSAAPGLNC